MTLVYDELHGIARRHLARERPGILQPTALVHEAYLRLIDQTATWQNRAQFFAIAARIMRRILVDHARAKHAAKRGGGGQRVALDEALVAFEERAVDLVVLDDAIERLRAIDERKARMVELRFFGGLTAEETADVLGIGLRSVEREWMMAKAWLRGQIEQERGRDA